MRLGVRAALVDGEAVDGDVTIEDGSVAEVGLTPRAAGSRCRGSSTCTSTGSPESTSCPPTATVRARPSSAGRYGRRRLSADVRTRRCGVRPRRWRRPAAATATACRGSRRHLEGPFLSRAWPARPTPHTSSPPKPAGWTSCSRRPAGDDDDPGPGAARRPGADRAAGRSGIVVSCGHSDADAAAHAAFDRGAERSPHPQRPPSLAARDPGLGGVALRRPDVTVQAIVDGVHLAPEAAYGAFLAAGERFCLVTDAVEAAAGGARRLQARGPPVDVATAQPGSPTGPWPAAWQRWTPGAPAGRRGAGAPAVHAASTAPARLLGRADLGMLSPGAPANITVLDDELMVTRTLVAAERRSRQREKKGLPRQRDLVEPGRRSGSSPRRRASARQLLGADRGGMAASGSRGGGRAAELGAGRRRAEDAWPPRARPRRPVRRRRRRPARRRSRPARQAGAGDGDRAVAEVGRRPALGPTPAASRSFSAASSATDSR